MNIFLNIARRKWTWKCTNGNAKNAISFIIAGKPLSVKIKPFEKKINTESDLRIIYCKVKFKFDIERTNIIFRKKHILRS